jgi:hypothetical protein
MRGLFKSYRRKRSKKQPLQLSRVFELNPLDTRIKNLIKNKMKRVKLLEEFIAEQQIEEGLFDVITSSTAFIKNPISATKITNNGKKLVKAEVDVASLDLDYTKKKEAADAALKNKIKMLSNKGDTEAIQDFKEREASKKRILDAANKQKVEALKDKVDAIKDRIDNLSNNNSNLEDLATLVKTAARIKKNEVLIKGADDEEKNQLKSKLQNDLNRINNIKKEISDTENSKQESETAKARRSLKIPQLPNRKMPPIPEVKESSDFKSFKDFFSEKS